MQTRTMVYIVQEHGIAHARIIAPQIVSITFES